jgi:histidinol-phosphate phosphatase family protein
MNGAKPAVFVDKDGTLIEDIPFNVEPGYIRLTAGAEKGLTLLRDHGYRLFVVTNQPGVAFGYFPECALTAVEHRIRELLSEFGVPLAGFAYCPHHPEGRVGPYARRCGCRKPAPGMLLEMAEVHGIELCRSWMIGDILDDVEAGRRAGCRTVLIDNGNETEWRLSTLRQPEEMAISLDGAARIILSSDRNPSFTHLEACL